MNNNEHLWSENLWSEKTTIYMSLIKHIRLKYYKIENNIKTIHTNDIKTIQNRVSSIVA